MDLEEFKAEFQHKEVTEYFNQVDVDPIVSVCVQTYQHASYIRDCLESILMQKINFPYELLLGEDASNDGTREICIEYAKKYPEKIRLFLHHRENNIKVNRNSTGRFNYLFNLFNARGKYISLCSGDDYWTDPLKLQKQVDFLEDNPDFAGAFHETEMIDPDGNIKRIYGKDAPVVVQAEDTISTMSIFHTSSFVFKNEIKQLPNWIFKVISGDMALFTIVSSFGPIKKIPGRMSVYRKHDGGVTETNAVVSNFYTDRIQLIKYFDKFHDHKYHKKAKKVLQELKEINPQQLRFQKRIVRPLRKKMNRLVNR